MPIPEAIREHYPIIEFPDLASHLVVRGISAVAFVRPVQHADGSVQWTGTTGRESFAKVSLTDRYGILTQGSDLPVGMVPFGAGDVGFDSTNEVSLDAGLGMYGFTIGDFVTERTAVRPVSWHEAHERKLRFSYEDGYSGIPGARERAVMAMTRFERRRELEKSRSEIDRLVSEAREALSQG